MQVILLNSIRKLGQTGKQVEVAAGYGRNYLLPKGFAVRATKDNIAKFSSIKEDLEKKNIERRNLAEESAKQLQDKVFKFVLPSAADGRLFGSVNIRMLAKKISNESSCDVDYSNILLEQPIKFNGVYTVQIAVHPEIVVSVLVVVAKTDSEAQEALQEFKSDNKEEDVLVAENL